MSFSTDIAKLVADQLSRFVTLNRHQLAGQVANLDFWINQARHVLAVIDGYGARFVKMHAAQEHHVSQHGTSIVAPEPRVRIVDLRKFRRGEDHPPQTRPAPPHRVPDRELQKARRALLDAASRFLERCLQDGLISESQMSVARRNLGME